MKPAGAKVLRSFHRLQSGYEAFWPTTGPDPWTWSVDARSPSLTERQKFLEMEVAKLRLSAAENVLAILRSSPSAFEIRVTKDGSASVLSIS
jgi:hypothetical protein